MSVQDKKILIVEDDRPIAELLAYRLEKEGFSVEMALTGSDALQAVDASEPDLLLLDWNLPDISGLDICQQITQTRKIPIIMITAKNLVEDKILGLESGADDYITKPFDVREIVARINATFRRLERAPAPPHSENDGVIPFSGLVVNTNSMLISRDGRAIPTTPLEYHLMMYFYENQDHVLTRDQILDAVWGYEYFGNTRTVDIHVLRLRKKLDLDKEIQTVFKVGYKFSLQQ